MKPADCLNAPGKIRRPDIARRLAASALLILAASPAGAQTPDVDRGRYLASIMDCGGCHAPRDANGVPLPGAGLSGGTVGFEVPGLGAFWPPNLTPHDTGLGGWTTVDIMAAIRSGKRPDGRILAPAMPFANYAHLTDGDAAALAAYLQSLEPVDHQVPPPAGPGVDTPAPAPVFRFVAPQD
ncbi:c-type cytochrome [Acuticoccus yangtzensis]|uniref:c-type cytochrome n=1 Tax=Acuticoccus yangtzensis TaxID=1443441 RepID=UPI000949763F|nr:cytochrome c [Acuticoccus yangtzensis]